MSEDKSAASLLEALSTIRPESLESDAQSRQSALSLSRQLMTSLEDPVNVAVDIMFTPFIATAVRVALDLDIFKPLCSASRPLTTAALANLSGGEELLMHRICRLLGGINFIQEAGPDLWTATPITHAMANPNVAAGHRFVWDILVQANVKLPQFLQETGYASPAEPTDSIIQYAHQTKYNTFEYMAKLRPDRLLDFHKFMGSTMGARNYWVDWFPVEAEILSEFDSNSGSLLVDIGGGKGHDLQAFCSKLPTDTGKLVLQDLADALASIKDDELDPRIVKQEHDFFTPNQERGARAYFLHHILHDWSDKYALQILESIVKAMKPGYSKLLIHELVLPDTEVSSYQARWDMTMMTFNAGIERSRTQWRELLKVAGLELVDFWHGPNGEDADGIVEAVLKP